MKVNYFYIVDEIHGRPITEIQGGGLKSLKEEFHPTKLTKLYPYSFIDITIEDPDPRIDHNFEAQNLRELLDIPLDVIEEIITDQRPRADTYQDHLLILFKFQTVKKSKPTIEINEHQVGLIIRENMVFSIHKEIPEISIIDIFKRFNKYPLRISRGGITYFVSSYVDYMIDKIYNLTNAWSERIEIYERETIENPKKELLFDVLKWKRNILDLVKILQADKEILNSLSKTSKIYKSIDPDEIPPELNDHINHLLDELDIIRNMLSEVINIYYNSDSAKLNETMKRYTFITSMFLAPTLIAGIFGMNNIAGTIKDFFFTLFLMIASDLVFYLFFKRKGFI